MHCKDSIYLFIDGFILGELAFFKINFDVLNQQLLL